MCGIIFSTIDPGKSFDLIKYRGPDETNMSKYNGRFIGHHRLEIVGDKTAGRQPIEYHDINNELVLVCNGEIYNYKAIDESAGSDCQVIIKAYLEGSLYTDQVLDGDYAFVLYDAKKDSVIIGRDPIGLKPLFYVIINTELIVCSELKVIEDMLKNETNVVIKPFPINTITEFKLGKSINKIKSSSTLTFSPQINPTDDVVTHHKNIYNLLYNATKKRILHTDKPFGILCSGGIDSSIITLMARDINENHHDNKNQTFTLGYSSGISYDLMYAKMVDPNIKVVNFDSKAAEYVPEVIRILETYDPNTIRASIPMYMLAKWIRENTDIKVILSGEGADELFLGYNYFHSKSVNYTDEQANEESTRLLKNLHSFDVLRAERCFSAHGLELRVPYLDRYVIQYVLGIHGSHKHGNYVEKQLLRSSVKNLFNKYGISNHILDRQKERLSDGVGYNWVKDLLRWVITKKPDYDSRANYTTEDLLNFEKEYYLSIYNSFYKTKTIIPRTMPEWAEIETSASENMLKV